MSVIIVSPHFKRREFACHCGCGFEAVDVELLQVLEDIRNHFNRSIRITSGCRCEAWNKRIGGSPKSYHVKAMASDIDVQWVPPRIVYNYIDQKYKDKYGLKVYSSWVHLDMRRKKWRDKGDV